MYTLQTSQTLLTKPQAIYQVFHCFRLEKNTRIIPFGYFHLHEEVRMSKQTTTSKRRVIEVADTGRNLVVAIFPFYKRVEYVQEVEEDSTVNVGRRIIRYHWL